jgi:hypothetical protein
MWLRPLSGHVICGKITLAHLAENVEECFLVQRCERGKKNNKKTRVAGRLMSVICVVTIGKLFIQVKPSGSYPPVNPSVASRVLKRRMIEMRS